MNLVNKTLMKGANHLQGFQYPMNTQHLHPSFKGTRTIKPPSVGPRNSKKILHHDKRASWTSSRVQFHQGHHQVQAVGSNNMKWHILSVCGLHDQLVGPSTSSRSSSSSRRLLGLLQPSQPPRVKIHHATSYGVSMPSPRVP